MYSYTWDPDTHGYKLTTQTGKFVANEIRPVFADELELLQFDQRFTYNKNETAPLMWAQKNSFWADGEKVAQLDKIEYGKPITAEYFFDNKKKLQPVNVSKMLENKENIEIMEALVFNTLKRIKEMFVQYPNSIPYIAFSGGKDSVVLLDLCHRVLPLNVPVVFSDTDMELPDTYKVWEQIQEKYPDRKFMRVQANKSAIENWQLFGPPSRVLRWCCSVHKSAPAIIALRNSSISTDFNLTSKLLCFVGVRGDESTRRSEYEDIEINKKNKNQIQNSPILSWSSAEIWLYIVQRNLIINEAYRKGLQRVGCILCPMSNPRYVEYVRRLYPKTIAPFSKEIIKQSNKKFPTKQDEGYYIYDVCWSARKSGAILKEPLAIPISEQKDSRLIFTIPKKKHKMFFEWLKVIGRIEKTIREPTIESPDYLCYTKYGVIEISINEQKGFEKITIYFPQTSQSSVIKYLVSHLYRILYKTTGCVACQACKASCPVDAITFESVGNNSVEITVHINEQNCIHCLKCNEIEYGCLRFLSKKNIMGNTMNISGIASYQNFGLKSEWITELIDKRENFKSSTALGNRMIQVAPCWFRESYLIEAGPAIKPTKLLSIAKKFGVENLILWQFIWMGLVNRSSLIKWFICNTQLDKSITTNELLTKLADVVTSVATQKGGISSLNGLFKNSPLGVGDSPLVRLEMKGKTVKSLTRLAVVPNNLAVLYGLYLMGQLTKRNSFTVREMLSADFESPCVSPLYAFGIEPQEFQRICNGLSSKYPDFLSVSFTLGLDEVRLNAPKTLNDVLDLVLNC